MHNIFHVPIITWPSYFIILDYNQEASTTFSHPKLQLQTCNSLLFLVTNSISLLSITITCNNFISALKITLKRVMTGVIKTNKGLMINWILGLFQSAPFLSPVCHCKLQSCRADSLQSKLPPGGFFCTQLVFECSPFIKIILLWDSILLSYRVKMFADFVNFTNFNILRETSISVSHNWYFCGAT